MRCGVIIFLIASIFGCYSEALTDVQKVASGNDLFTANVYKELAKKSNNNIIVSGLSAEIVLSLLANGAKGKTQQEILKCLNLPENLAEVNNGYQEILSRLTVNSEHLKLLSANKIYPADGFSILKSFNDTAVNEYKAGVQNLDYNNAQLASNTINQWVEEQTNNKIKNLILPDMLDSNTVLVLVNALYFSGKWNDAFEKYSTQKKPFFTSATESKEIDTMYTETNALYSYNEKLKAKFLELGFQGGNVSMVFVLPDSRTGLQSVEQNLAEYLKPQKMESARVAINLPRFKIESNIDFKSILESCGMKTMFSSASDLSGISSSHPLKVDFVIQKAFIDVNEDGVEAAAATAIGVKPLALFRIQYHFKADHPFLFYIRDSGITLFAGHFKN